MSPGSEHPDRTAPGAPPSAETGPPSSPPEPTELPRFPPGSILHRFLSGCPFLVCVVDRRGRIVRLNDRAAQFFEPPASRLKGLRIAALAHPADRREALGRLRPDVEDDARDEVFHVTRLRHRDGAYRTVEWTILRRAESPWAVLFGKDVTEDRAIRAEMKAMIRLLEAELRQRTLELAGARTRLEDLRREGSDEDDREPATADTVAPVLSGEPYEPEGDLFERIPLGALRVATDQRIVAVNPAARALLGDEEEDRLLGARPSVAVFADPRIFRSVQDRLAERGEIRSMKIQVRHPTAGPTPLLLDALRIRSSRGRHRYDELFLRSPGARAERRAVPDPDSLSNPLDLQRDRGPDPRSRFPHA